MNILRLARAPIVAGAVALWLIGSFCFFTFGPYRELREKGDGARLLEERFGYAEDASHTWLERIGPDGRSQYRTFQILDVGNAFLLAVALSLALTLALSRLLGPTHWAVNIAYLPFAVLLLEIVENAFLLFVASRHPQQLPMPLQIASVATTTKLLTSFALFPLTFSSLAALGLQRFWRRAKGS